MTTPSKTVAAVQQLLADREQVGLAKYGTTVDRTDLQAGDWLQHAIEEAADLLLYLVRLRETMPPEECAIAQPRKSRMCPCGNRTASNCSEDGGPHCDKTTDHAAYLARWKDAPAEATHLSQDKLGQCWFHIHEPSFKSEFKGFYGGEILRTADNLLGQLHCERRPGR